MKKSLVIISITITIFFVFAGPVFAAPSVINVSGTFSDGQSVTISGSGFGTKSPAAPDKWHNFENLTVGNKVDTSGVYSQFGPSHDILINNAVKRNAGIVEKSAHCWWTTSAGYDQTWGLRNVSYNSIYLSGWYYFKLGTGTGRSRNFKLFQFGGSGGAGDPNWGRPQWRWDMYETTGAPDCTYYGGGHQLFSACTTDDLYLNVWAIEWADWVLDEGIWVRVEVWVDLDHGGNNGRWQIWRNGQQWAVSTGKATSGDCNFDHIYISPYYATDQCTPKRLDLYWDEVYIDTTRARVELGNASTWAACTHREIQIPSAWLDSSITVKVNQGSFAIGNTAYLYVVDSTGALNANGYPVTIGASSPSDTTPPAPPSGVTIS